MKTGRMLTTVSAMAFGLALVGAVPAVAQSATAGGATGNSTGMDQTTAQNGAAPTAEPQTNGAPGTATQDPVPTIWGADRLRRPRDDVNHDVRHGSYG